MLLNEMFSAIGAPKNDQSDIDWVGDLKFFIDNDDKILSKYFFPAIKKHIKNVSNPNVYKVYVNPLKTVAKIYCHKFDVKDPHKKFTIDTIIELAKMIANEQSELIKRGEYES